MPNGLPISKENFRQLNTTEAKMDAFFDVLEHMNDSGFECEADRVAHRTECDRRIKKLEDRKKIDTTIGAFSGFIGGIITIIGSKLFKI